MSLTRAEWEQMWKEIKRIEIRVFRLSFRNGRAGNAKHKQLDQDIESIKTKIQSVIGQQE